MTDKKIQDLKFKVADFKRFAYILLAISGFMALGMVLPGNEAVAGQEGLLMALVGGLLIGSFFFHRQAMNIQRLIHEEEAS
ncbi:YrhC family protein [Bacillus shivajii]|uniref:YrhC family protein n=1 Tax=Bacillus shivajii TaxID=1983719 RepID=UPI001CFA0D4B|nr:YrhC family protein [Bacillus shivajii]UCZ54402.1 YrhC family protein [Bacillus shivajii]